MKIGIMQPYFFPYIGYFQLIKAVDKFVFFDDVKFIKGGWINRNRVLVNGKPSYFNAGMVGGSPNKLLNEVVLDQNQLWRKKLIKTVQSSYGRAPEFGSVFPFLVELLNLEITSLSKFNIATISAIMDFLDLSFHGETSSAVYNDIRHRGVERVVEICKRNNVSEYINPIGGLDLYRQKDFAAINAELRFVKMINQSYKQFSGEFIPYLSIIDVLMFNNISKIREMIFDVEFVRPE